MAIPREMSIRNALSRLDEVGTGALIVTEHGRIFGILTDGDVRRAYLRGIDFNSACGMIATREPVLGSPQHTEAQLLKLMNQADVHHLPIIRSDGIVEGLVLRSDLVARPELSMDAVIMAGGYGTRMLPFTANVPKPMLPIGGRPLLQHTIEGLKHAGVRHVHITTHHLSEKITEHFGDGSSFGVALHYLNEDSPLGTAGGLRLLGEQAEAFLVINGDILTTLDFRAALAFHREHKAQLTVGVRPYDVRIPYGVVRSAGAQVLGVDEKPTITTLVNAGVYIVEPDVLQHIPQNLHFDMTDLIESLLAVGKTVVSFPILEYWRDIGHPLDYEQAQSDIKSGVAAR